jgi:hypothetical protein
VIHHPKQFDIKSSLREKQNNTMEADYEYESEEEEQPQQTLEKEQPKQGQRTMQRMPRQDNQQNQQQQQVQQQQQPQQMVPMDQRVTGNMGGRTGAIRESRIKDRPQPKETRDSSLKIKIELDLEVEVNSPPPHHPLQASYVFLRWIYMRESRVMLRLV